MPKVANYYFRTAILFLIAGIILGLQMGMSQNHNVIPAHAHLNLLGWVTSALFGGYLALNPAKAAGRLALIQYAIYTIGVLVMTLSLYLTLVGNAAFEPIIAIGAVLSAIGVLLFAWIIYMPAPARA